MSLLKKTFKKTKKKQGARLAWEIFQKKMNFFPKKKLLKVLSEIFQLKERKNIYR